MGMVCCVAKFHDSAQDDLKHDAEVMSPQPEIDLENTRQKDISRHRLTDCDNKKENKVLRQVEDNTNMDVTQEVDHASVEDHSIDSYSINLLSLPTELLVKIMLYLPIIDIGS